MEKQTENTDQEPFSDSTNFQKLFFLIGFLGLLMTSCEKFLVYMMINFYAL